MGREGGSSGDVVDCAAGDSQVYLWTTLLLFIKKKAKLSKTFDKMKVVSAFDPAQPELSASKYFPLLSTWGFFS